MSRYFILVFSY